VPDSSRRQYLQSLPGAARKSLRRFAHTVRFGDSANPPQRTGSAGSDDPDENLAWNRQRWGDATTWRKLDSLGYQWGGGFEQTPATVAALADRLLRPYVGSRYDLAILEISPGGGRMTAELIRYASRLSLVDLNAAAIDICRERFAVLPIPIEFVVNDGQSLAAVEGGPFDLVACYDSMVHMHPDVIRRYVAQLPALLVDGGTAWLDHSGKGKRSSGARTAMTAELMGGFAADAGLVVNEQVFRNDWDCISVLTKP
jgi:SAM-dependent methyltransferase